MTVYQINKTDRPCRFPITSMKYIGKKLTLKEAANACSIPVGTFYAKARKLENMG